MSDVNLNNVVENYEYLLDISEDSSGNIIGTITAAQKTSNGITNAYDSYENGVLSQYASNSDDGSVSEVMSTNVKEEYFTSDGIVFFVTDEKSQAYNKHVFVQFGDGQEYSVGDTIILSSSSSTYTGETCFLFDSMIETPNGLIPVQDIQPGDEVTVYVDGELARRKIVWAGKSHAVIRLGLPDDEAGYPVRILKDAIADGVPYKDMLITAEHSLFFDGRFVPARMLVNGRSIFYDKSITSYDYYHIETEKHSVIMADGMLTESYLDTGNRHTFRQEGNVVAFTPSRNLTWDDAAVPLGVSREFVEPLFRQAEARAISAGITQKDAAPELTEEANFHLVIDTGAVIRPVRKHNGRVMFMIPTGVKNVRIVSNASRPSDVIGPFVDDRRYFGVAVGEITMFEAGRNHSVTAHLTEKELEGWNTLEWEDTRWTSGNALLPLGERNPNSVALLAIQIKKEGPYLLDDTVTSKTALQA